LRFVPLPLLVSWIYDAFTIHKPTKVVILLLKFLNIWIVKKSFRHLDVRSAPKGTRSHFGSLLLAERKNGKLTSIGAAGTGFTEKSLKDIHAKLKQLIRKTSPLNIPIKETADMTWVEPVMVCTIKFTEITEDGNARHPVFQVLKIDKESV